jgi:hypothetical protein
MLQQIMYSFSVSLAPLLNDSFLFAFLQLGVFITFVITAVRAWQVSPARLRELLTAVVFGLLLEEGDIVLFGTYNYNPHWISLGYVPIAIALSWAMIIASAMNFSDALGLPSIENLPRTRGRFGLLRWLARGALAPMADALWAIILDLSLDAVAIRLKLWTWTIPIDQGWFGVPWGNFFAWLFVAAFFSFFTRIVRRLQAERGPTQGWWQLAVPLLAYVGLLVTIESHGLLEYKVFQLNQDSVWPLFALTLTFITVVTLYALARERRRPREAADRWLIGVRAVIHFYFLAAIFVTGIFLQLPVLLWTALAMIALELVLTYRLTHPARPSALLSQLPARVGKVSGE